MQRTLTVSRLTTPRISLLGDVVHLMTPFADVDVNVAMEHALELSGALVDAEDQTPVADSVREYGLKMWKRAHEAPELNLMYQGLFPTSGAG